MKLVHETTDINGLHPAFWGDLFALDDLWRRVMGYELHITHALDGSHSRYSRHYQGCAVDLRTWTTPTSGNQVSGLERKNLLEAVRVRLGPAYKVLDERTHFHVALKPTDKAWTKL